MIFRQSTIYYGCAKKRNKTGIESSNIFSESSPQLHYKLLSGHTYSHIYGYITLRMENMFLAYLAIIYTLNI